MFQGTKTAPSCLRANLDLYDFGWFFCSLKTSYGLLKHLQLKGGQVFILKSQFSNIPIFQHLYCFYIFFLINLSFPSYLPTWLFTTWNHRKLNTPTSLPSFPTSIFSDMIANLVAHLDILTSCYFDTSLFWHPYQYHNSLTIICNQLQTFLYLMN